MLNVLVAEDSVAMRQVLSMGLKHLDGVRVLEADNGARALQVLNREPVDLLITDLRMPVLDGFKLIAAVRSDPRFRNLRIAVITTEGSDRDRDQAIGLGADSYLTKPIQLRQVEELVHEVRHG